MRNFRQPFRFFSEPYFRFTRIVFIVLLICLVITQHAAAQFMKLTRFAEDEGLSNSLVKSVTTDRNGLVWIATDGAYSSTTGMNSRICQKDFQVHM